MKVLLIHDKGFRPALHLMKDEMAEGTDGRVGVDAHLAQLTKGLSGRGLDVAVVRFVGASPEGMESEPGYHEVRSTLAGTPYVAARLGRIVAEEKPDVIHTHSSYYALNSLVIRYLLRLRPLVHTVHDVTLTCPRRTRIRPDGTLCDARAGMACMERGCFRAEGEGTVRSYIRALSCPILLREYRRLQAIIVPSRFMRDQLLLHDFDGSRIRVIPHSPRFGSHPSSGRAKPGTILYVGRLVREKGVLEFVEALSMLRSRRGWKGVIAGGGDFLMRARSLAERHGLTNRVTFTGEVGRGDIERLYRECAFVVLPSLIPESFGLVGVEAMSFGKPVVAFDAGGVREWLREGQTGLLAPHGDVSRLARLMEMLLEDEALRERLGENGLRIVSERFDAERQVASVMEVYADTVREWPKK